MAKTKGVCVAEWLKERKRWGVKRSISRDESSWDGRVHSCSALKSFFLLQLFGLNRALRKANGC